MELLFENNFSEQPLVSIILLDWSVRESYHVLDYLSNQTVPREQYEIIWIEYYDKRPKEIEIKLKESSAAGKPPAIDKWVVMNMPHNIYYHKHLMYNVGIVVSKGRIVTFMDSDAIVRPTFIKEIIETFEKNNNIVLHMDQVRNVNKRYYPFNYPSIEEITDESCTNISSGKPIGLVDKSDPLHLPNYGACMSARRDDLISIGGADEHIDYLGHICGPYEMTFRLVNAGKKELWHPNEWLYHAWHPGQAGDKNFAGPHDGHHMSTTALDARWTGRILTLVENPAVRMLRLNQTSGILNSSLLSHIIQEEEIKKWTVDEGNWKVKKYKVGTKTIIMRERGRSKYGPRLNLVTNLNLSKILFKMFAKHIYIWVKIILKNDIKYALTFITAGHNVANTNTSGLGKEDESSMTNINPTETPMDIWDRIFRIFKGIWYRIKFIQSIAKYNRFVADECWRHLHRLSKDNKAVAVFGVSSLTEIMFVLSRDVPIKISVICDDVKRKKFSGFDVLPVESLKGYKGSVIIASVFGVEERVETIKKIGIKEDKVIRIL